MIYVILCSSMPPRGRSHCFCHKLTLGCAPLGVATGVGGSEAWFLFPWLINVDDWGYLVMWMLVNVGSCWLLSPWLMTGCFMLMVDTWYIKQVAVSELIMITPGFLQSSLISPVSKFVRVTQLFVGDYLICQRYKMYIHGITSALDYTMVRYRIQVWSEGSEPLDWMRVFAWGFSLSLWI